jgi:phosphoribosylglycinamide formyltransferase-1
LKRLVILASGNGSLAQAIIDDLLLGGQIVALISDRTDAHVLERARTSAIPTYVIDMKSDRKVWDKEILNSVNNLKPDLVISAGFMRILSPDFVQTFPTINSHPALLPLFPGAHAVRDALAAGVSETGTTIHWVDKGVDTGKTMKEFVATLHKQSPASIQICTLLHKPEALQHPLDLKYVGFEIPNKFVVGYGLDYDGFGRNSQEIFQLDE